ncbi:MAG: DUF695 domain-containing protein [Phycisphaerales bacterium]|nr:DUF695 domain-containing protein [Phycisphaerales bacterium]
MSDQWDFYFSAINDEPASIRLDLDPTADIDSADFPARIRIDVPFQNMTDNGMPTDDEWKSINEIDDAIENWAAQSKRDVYVAAVTWPGRRSFFLYSNREEAPAEDIARLLKRVGREQFDIELEDDPDWREFYEVLYPTPIDMQWMGDRDLVEQLRALGDTLETPRSVDHTALFRSTEDRERFIVQATERGYAADHQDNESASDREAAADDDFPYSVTVTKSHAADLDSVHEHTSELCVLADECNGMYDGWGCAPAK